MMVPNEFDFFPKATGTLPITTPTSVAPIPTVIPSVPIFQDLHDTGKRTLWVVTVLMGISSLVFYALAARAPLSKRVFHTLTALTTTLSFITYLALSTGQGISYKSAHITHHHKHVPNTTDIYLRQVLWLRYINWALSTPLILTNFALVSGLPGGHLFAAIAANFVMLAAGVLGSFAGHTKVRWVWLVISCLAYLVLVHHGGFHAQRAAGNKDVRTKRFFAALSGLAFFAFALFPISLAAGSLALKISVDVETVLLAIQDIFTQGLLGYWLLVQHDSAQGITLYVDGFWSSGVGNEGAIRITEEDGA
jgi:bacteriorhodopsin